MIYTVKDADAAIRRSPQSLEELSKAADLLIELGDPRGEDFAACLDGRLGAEALMRRYPACVSAMFVAALKIARVVVPCPSCWGSGRSYFVEGPATFRVEQCQECEESVEVGDDPAALAAALRLLAECGKTGTSYSPIYTEKTGYWPPNYAVGHRPWPEDSTVADSWFRAMCDLSTRRLNDAVNGRFTLMIAYAKADAATRERWRDETTRIAAMQSGGVDHPSSASPTTTCIYEESRCE